MNLNSELLKVLNEAATVQSNSGSLSLDAVLREGLRGGLLLKMLRNSVVNQIVAVQAASFGFSPTDDQLQQAANQFRLRAGLRSAKQTRMWLDARRLTVTDFEEMILSKLRRQLVFARVTQNAAEQFAGAPSIWDRLSFQQLIVQSESLAEELKCQCLEDGIPVAKLAAQHLTLRPHQKDQSRLSMFRGKVPDWASPLFSEAECGALIGPVTCPAGWALISVESVIPATFDSETELAIRQTLFQQWLSAKMRTANISYPLLDLLTCSNHS